MWGSCFHCRARWQQKQDMSDGVKRHGCQLTLIDFASLLMYGLNAYLTHDKQCSNSWYRVKMCRWISVKHDGWSYGDLEPDLCTQAFCAICAPAINIWFTWKHVITQSARGNVWQGRSVSKRFSESICRTSQIRMSISKWVGSSQLLLQQLFFKIF